MTSEDLAGAQWIWHPDAHTRSAEFRRSISFDQPVDEIDFYITASDKFELRVNDRSIGSSADYRRPCEYRVPRPIARDESVITIKVSGSEGTAGLLCNMVVRFRDGKSKVIGTDSVWKCAPERVNASISDADWVYAKQLGAYPCAPWGEIFKEKWENVSARVSEIRKHPWHPSGPGDEPARSEFRGEYVRPDYAQLYRSFVTLNPGTGLLQTEGRVIRPFFALYSQPGPDEPIRDIPNLDFDLLRKDFARMKEAGVNVEARVNWSDLLNADGSWKQVLKQPKGRNIPTFKYVCEIYDYFLDCAQANGLYVNLEPSFSTGLNLEVIPSGYAEELPLYDLLWKSAQDAYARIFSRFSHRTVIVSTVVGRDLKLGDSLNEPVSSALFKRYLENKYGSIGDLRQAWKYGYNYADHSKWERRTIDGRLVLRPEYPFVKGAFDSLGSFDDVQLPMVDFYRSIDPPLAPLYDLPTNQENLTLDPAWIDFTQMREDLLTSQLNQLCDALRSADGNHLLAYVESQDLNPIWRSTRPADKGDMHYDLLCVDGGASSGETDRFIRVMNFGRPYAEMNGNGLKGIACSNMSASTMLPSEFADLLGGGAAFAGICDWGKISGGGDVSLNELAGFLSSVQDSPLKLRKDARVLILRNTAGMHSLDAGYDIGNVMGLAEILYRLHIPFDILPDSDVVPGIFGPGAVNMEKYGFIFVPEQNQMLVSETWQMLSDWISDPRYLGKRGLCIGLCQDQDEHFSPVEPSAVHPAFEKLIGVKDYASRIKANGDVKLQYARFIGSESRGKEIPLQFPENGELGVFAPGANGPDSILQLGDRGPSVAIRNMVNGNPVYACGFYLGLCYDRADGASRSADPADNLGTLYAAMLKSAGVDPIVGAPKNISVYFTEDSSVILIHESSGIRTDCNVTLPHSSGSNFFGAETVQRADGSLLIRNLHFDPHGYIILRKAAGIGFSGGKDVSAVCGIDPDDTLEYEISGSGKTTAIFDLKPGVSYLVRRNGAVLTTAYPKKDGKFRLSLDLGSPTRITLKQNKHK
jgi:hypothetical protein